MTKKLLAGLLLLIASTAFEAKGQALSAYTDYRGYLQVFDRGMFYQAEYLPVRSYQVGGNAVAYIDNRSDFRIFQNGKANMQVNAADFWYQVTNNLIAYKVGNVLYVYDNGQKKILSYYNDGVYLGDSLLAWFDNSNYLLNIYYNGRTAELESSLLEKPKTVKAGPNTLAWVNQSNFFKIFYHGQTYTLDNIPPREFQAGRDIVGYVDDYNGYFHLFYKGDTASVEIFPPDSFKVGWSIAAYVDNLGDSRIFSAGATRRIMPDRPDFFYVVGNVICWGYNGDFNIFWNGNTYVVDRFIPREFKIGPNGVAYLDASNQLKYWYKGENATASYESVLNYALNGDVLKFTVGTNTVKVFYEGRAY